MPATKMTMSGETIAPESMEPASDKRGGYLVRFARTTIRGRNGSTVWKDVRFLNGKYQDWPKRWDTSHLKQFEALAMRTIDENLDKFERKEKVLFRPEVDRADALLRDVNALDRKMHG